MISRCSFLEGQPSWISTHGSHSPSISSMLAWASLPPPPPPLPAINVYHMLFWLHHKKAPHAQTSQAFSFSKWGRGPQAQALPVPVAHLTLPWPHPLAWYCRYVWSLPYHWLSLRRRFVIGQWPSFTAMEHGPPQAKSCIHGHGSMYNVITR